MVDLAVGVFGRLKVDALVIVGVTVVDVAVGVFGGVWIDVLVTVGVTVVRFTLGVFAGIIILFTVVVVVVLLLLVVVVVVVFLHSGLWRRGTDVGRVEGEVVNKTMEAVTSLVVVFETCGLHPSGEVVLREWLDLMLSAAVGRKTYVLKVKSGQKGTEGSVVQGINLGCHDDDDGFGSLSLQENGCEWEEGIRSI